MVANITGDGRVDDIRRCHGAALNVVQCSGSTMDLAKMMEEQYGIPSLRVSYFGIEDMAESLYAVARFFKRSGDDGAHPGNGAGRAGQRSSRSSSSSKALSGKKAAIYVGGAFKAFSLVKAFRLLGMKVVLVGSQTGTKEDYQELREICDPGTIIVDDANPLELSAFLKEKEVDIFVGGVKERPIAFKLGVGFCDHNHERKECSGRLRRHAQLRPRGLRLGDEPGVAVRAPESGSQQSATVGGLRVRPVQMRDSSLQGNSHE